MTDDMEDLKRSLKKEPPLAPAPENRERAIQHAMRAFDAANATSAQGIGLMDRLKDTASAVFDTLIGRRPMRYNPAFAGGAGLGVFLIATLATVYIQSDFDGPMMGRVPQAVAPLPQAPKEKRLAQEAPAAPVAQSDAESSTSQFGMMRKQPAPPQVAAQQNLAPSTRAAVRKSRQVAPELGRPRAAFDQARRPSVAQLRPAPDQLTGGQIEQQGRDRFESVTPNPVKITTEDPVSTFSVDVDTASYSFMRASLNNNVLPQKDAVRVEELINYFPYDYARPADRSVPFKANLSLFPAPWNAEKKLLHIGIAGYELEQAEKPRSNLVFLIDTSGSMQAVNKLPLVVNAMKLLLTTLKGDDTVSIVTYAGGAGTVLEPTKVSEKAKILQALDRLGARGSTAGAEGIRQAYALARANYDKDGVNRVILATDGDFNVGITNRDELKSYIERQRKTGIFLSVLGFGRGNYNDALMQTLAQNGNGNAAYIDTLNEARKVLVEEAGSTLFPIASDVKLQIEFNPQRVAEYRLIGYETRLLRRDDFNNDQVDAGDIGAGHTVTAIYEITPTGSESRLVDDLRYGAPASQPASGGQTEEYAFLKIRYKLPGETASKLITAPVDRSIEAGSIAAAPNEARFATSVAAFGQILRGGRHTGTYSYDDVIKLAQGAKGDDPFGYRAEFINLVRLATSATALEPLKRR